MTDIQRWTISIPRDSGDGTWVTGPLTEPVTVVRLDQVIEAFDRAAKSVEHASQLRPDQRYVFIADARAALRRELSDD